MDRTGVHIGVAGYMGVGKSTFCGIFARAGFTIVNADAEAKRVMDADTDLKNQLCRSFGPVVSGRGSIDSPALGAAVFASAQQLVRFNELTRPVLTAYFENRLAALADRNTVLDAALIPLWTLTHRFDQLFWIDAPREVRIKRLTARSGATGSVIAARAAAQEQIMVVPTAGWTRIDNSGGPAVLAETAARFIEQLTAGCQQGVKP